MKTDTFLYLVVLASLGVGAIVLGEIFGMILSTPWAVGLRLLEIALFCPVVQTVEEWIFGETTFEDEP